MDLKKIYVQMRSELWNTVEYHTEKSSAVWSYFWTILVSGGRYFKDDDIIKLQKYLHKNNYVFNRPGEHHYEQAVRVNNISFCKAYERLTGRKPFIWDNIDYEYGWGELPYGMHSTQAKTKGRLVIGAGFVWQGEVVKVTSFKDDAQSLVACKYVVVKEGEVCDKCGCCKGSDETKISRRFIITAEDMESKLKARQKEKKELKKQQNTTEDAKGAK
jgi:hypothetical protein